MLVVHDVLELWDWGELREQARRERFGTEDPFAGDVFRGGERGATAVCFDWDTSIFWAKVGPVIERAARVIDPSFPTEQAVGHFELTRMDAGGFFRRHIDSPYGDPSAPCVTFVYYLGDRASFSGGELVVSGETVEPADNTLVMYRGSEPHEVLPIVGGTGAIRLTVNGYLSV